MTITVPRIRLVPDPILEQPTTLVAGDMWAQLPEVERDLRTAMAVYPAVGFAANQLGHDFRVLILKRDTDDLQVLVNPKIVSFSPQKMEDWEGCMSIPDKLALVDRSLRVVVTSNRGKKARISHTFRDFEARIVQHEIDHLDGITILDKAIEVEDVERAD